jgi:hypothetical protein
MSLGITQDTAVGTYDRWQYLAMLEATTKPINITAVDIEGLKDQLEMAYIRLGGKENWKAAPCFSLYNEPVSPLSHSEEVIQKLLFCADNDIPIVYTPCPLAGATSPATLAGTMVQALTESLFGIVLSQLRKPGTQVIIGGLMSAMDMQTAVYWLTRNGPAQRGLHRDHQVAARARVRDSRLLRLQVLRRAGLHGGRDQHHDGRAGRRQHDPRHRLHRAGPLQQPAHAGRV